MDFCWLGAGGGGTKEKGKNGKIPFLSPLVLLFPFPLVFFPSSVEWLEKFDCLSIHKSTINGEKRRKPRIGATLTSKREMRIVLASIAKACLNVF